MAFSDLAKKVSELGAPLLSSALGSPLAGIALSLIGRAFNVDATTPESTLAMIMRDPDAAVKLKELELSHEIELKRIATQNFMTEVDDRKSARTMAAGNHHFTDVLSLVIIMIYAFVQYHVVSHTDPGDDLISARVQDVVMLILSFYYGSSLKK